MRDDLTPSISFPLAGGDLQHLAMSVNSGASWQQGLFLHVFALKYVACVYILRMNRMF